MGDGFNFAKLSAEIIALSVATRWEEAFREWRLFQIYEADEVQTCLCGHHPIHEICVLHNSKNGNEAEVGNVCVNRFMGIESQKIFDGIKRIQKDIEKSLTIDAILIARERILISDWEKTFYLDIRLKRNLTDKQLAKKIQVNTKVLNGMRRMKLDK